MKGAYELYPIAEILTAVPLGMYSSVYTLPEVPTIGLVRGTISSSIGARTNSTMMGCVLKASCARIR